MNKIFMYDPSSLFGTYTFPKTDYALLRSEFPTLPSKYENEDGDLVYISPKTLEAMCEMNDFLDRHDYVAVSNIPQPQTQTKTKPKVIQVIINIFIK